MRPSFEQYEIQARVIDVFEKLIYRYDPPSINSNNKPLYVLNDGDHIYVLNHDITSLQHKLKNESEGNDLQILPVGNNYYINPKPQTPKYIMIENEDEMYNEIEILDKEKRKMIK